jgi:transcription-repair coupling factor (superfamily II helicase)
VFTALPKRSVPYLIVANDLDEAGYIYNDLCQLSSEQRVLVFPSGYKRDIKYGQVDAPQEILRTEVLNRWHNDPDLRWVVTYPEALAEKVAPRENIDRDTITLEVGVEVDLTQVAIKLRELQFQEVDYVYEPGQFSVRGSILDVFSFSNEYPYRIDFFGD